MRLPTLKILFFLTISTTPTALALVAQPREAALNPALDVSQAQNDALLLARGMAVGIEE